MNNIDNTTATATAGNAGNGEPEKLSTINLVESIERFDYTSYKEEEDQDYKPDPEVEEEIIQEYQNEAEQLQADEIYHNFVESVTAGNATDVSHATSSLST